MGLPINRLICASNQNNVLTSFLTTGVYDLSERRLVVSASPAIDILKSSNLERFLYHQSDAGTKFVQSCYDDLEKKQKFQIPDEVCERYQVQ